MDSQNYRSLYLLRHSKSDWTGGEEDFDRGLSPRGKKDRIRIGKFIKKSRITWDIAYVSASNRTRMTFKSISNFANEFRFEDEIYEAEVENLLKFVENIPNSYNKVLILGHNPGLESLLETILGQSVLAKFPTSGMAKVIWKGDWRDFKIGDPKLVFFWIPHPDQKDEMVDRK